MWRGHKLNSVQQLYGAIRQTNLNLVGKCPASSNNVFYSNTVSLKANIAYGAV